ncbi:hypothetical protein L611_001800000380 [Aminobacter sp. J15]|nr:hypothetical protein L610_002000000430 [Aminobacter sp. J44]TWH34050.1 hypothetical protein L611_001800000380 [Aminobacter sp. J15]
MSAGFLPDKRKSGKERTQLHFSNSAKYPDETKAGAMEFASKQDYEPPNLAPRPNRIVTKAP